MVWVVALILFSIVCWDLLCLDSICQLKDVVHTCPIDGGVIMQATVSNMTL